MRKTVALVTLAMASNVVASAHGTSTSEWRVNPSVLKCVSTNSGTAVVLSLGQRHGKELAIQRNSDSVWYMLVLGGAPKEMRALMSPEQFQRKREVLLSSSTTGYRWGREERNERIFTSPGKYTVYVSDNLETETSGHRCDVTFTGKHAG